MMNKMRCVLGLALLCGAPAMAGEWVQEGVVSFATGLFAGTEIDRLG